jgi:hypothetical protein
VRLAGVEAEEPEQRFAVLVEDDEAPVRVLADLRECPWGA